MTIFLILPAYNEEIGLVRLLEAFWHEVRKAGYTSRVIVVDDGSSDGTGSVARAWSSVLPLELIVHPSNRGLGETLRDGLRRALELAEPADVIVTMDADNTHPASLIPEMVRLIQNGCDVVIASRYRHGSKVTGLSLRRRLMSCGARLFFTVLFHVKGVRDYTSGFRAYKPSLLARAFQVYGDDLITEPGFAATAELLLKLGRLRPHIQEVPMHLAYDKKAGATKMRVARTVLATLRMAWRVRY